MTANKAILLIFPLLALTACNGKISEENPPKGNIPEEMRIYAKSSTKTSLNEDLSVNWMPGDEISIFDNGGNRRFTTSDKGLSAIFKGESIKESEHYALYPYDRNAVCDMESGVITTTVPSRQTGRPGDFADGANLAAGKLSGTNFTARNIGGIIRFSLIRNDVTEVTFTSRDASDALSGKVCISFNEDGTPATDPIAGSSSVTLQPEGEAFAPGTYYITVLSCEMASGYTVTIKSRNGETHELGSDGLTSVKRSHYIDIKHLDQGLSWGIEVLDIVFWDEEKGGYSQPFTEDIPTSITKGEKEYTLKDSGHKVTIGTEIGYYISEWGSFSGLCLTAGAKGKGWVSFPAIEGKRLAYVTIYSGTTMTTKKNYYIVKDISDLSSPLSNMALSSQTSSASYAIGGVSGSEMNTSYSLCVDPSSNANATLKRIVCTYEADGVGRDYPPYDIEVRQSSTSPWEIRCANTIDNIPGFELEGDPATDQYGGWICDLKFPATGHFYTTRDESGRWWFADPLGNPFISKGLCGFRLDLGSATAKKAFEDKYGSDKKKWGAAETEWIRGRGFNSYGAFSGNNGYLYSDMPYIVHPTPMGSYRDKYYAGAYPDGCTPVFDEAFPGYAESIMQSIATYADDPRALGIITDNEISWDNTLLANCLATPESNVNHKAAAKWLSDNGLSVSDADNVTVRQRFSAYCLETYLKIITDLRDKYAPHLPYLGCKFDARAHELVNPYAFEVAGRYMDAISIDYYHEWEPSQEQILRWNEWSGKPVMWAEWYIKGQDSGMANVSGVGWEVKTQKQRGYYYQMNCIALIKSGASVGWQWFRYMDNDPEADNSGNLSNIDANKGVVNVKMEQYTDFLDVMQQLNDNTYNLCRFYGKL